MSEGVTPWLVLEENRPADPAWVDSVRAAATRWVGRYGDQISEWQFELALASEDAGPTTQAAAALGALDPRLRLSPPTDTPVARPWLPRSLMFDKAVDATLFLQAALGHHDVDPILPRFIDEAVPGRPLLFGGLGLLTIRGLRKPAWHAARALASLGEELLSSSRNAVATRRTDGTIALLAVNAETDRSPLQIDLSGLDPSISFTLEMAGRGHGDVESAWRDLGSPPSPTLAVLAELACAAATTHRVTVRTDSVGRLRQSLELPAWSFALITQHPIL